MGLRPPCYMHVSFHFPWYYTSSLIYHFQNFGSQHCDNLQFYACILLVLKDVSREAETACIPWRPDCFASQQLQVQGKTHFKPDLVSTLWSEVQGSYTIRVL